MPAKLTARTPTTTRMQLAEKIRLDIDRPCLKKCETAETTTREDHAVTRSVCETRETAAGLRKTAGLLPGHGTARRSSQSLSVEYAFSTSQIESIRENSRDATEDSHLALQARIPLPTVRTKESRRVGNGSTIQKRPKLHGKQTVSIDILVHLPIRQE